MKKRSSLLTSHTKLLPVILLGMQLAGCGGGDVSSSNESAYSSSSVSDLDVVIGGSVGDGPIVGATVSVYSRDGTLINTQVSDSNATYQMRIRAPENAFPLTIVAEGGSDLVTGLSPDFTLKSVTNDPSVQTVNVNPFTTVITETAERMPGGPNEANLNAARATVQEYLNFGLDPVTVPDPSAVPVDQENVAMIVKSSEAFGEAIRRTRDKLKAQDAGITGDVIVDRISADLTDGQLDGAGSAGTDMRTTAVVEMASAQVLIESMSNNLRVGGTVATQAMDSSISTTHNGISANSLTASVRVRSNMIRQAKAMVRGAKTVAPSMGLNTIENILDQIPPDSSASQVESVLPGDTSQDLESAITMATAGSDSDLNTIIDAVATEFTSPQQPGNVAPVISGQPATTVAEDSMYRFAPVASDADAEQLTYSIVNRPQWANFSTATGVLTGTPRNSDVGLYSNITVSVTDGVATASIGPFSINVTNTNDAPSISGTPGTVVQQGSNYVFTPAANDVDGDRLNFSISNKPVWAVFSSTTGVMSGTPGSAHVGTVSNIVISVSDGSSTASLPAFSISVSALPPSNYAPTLSGSPVTTVAEDAVYRFAPVVSDRDGDTLTFSIANRPAWASFNASTGVLSGTPRNNDVGTYSGITISVSDGTASASIGPFGITVTGTNDAPTISGVPRTTVAEDSSYQFAPVASDPDGDALSYSIVNRPGWASFNSSTGVLSGTPRNGDVGTATGITITVSDGTASASIGPFAITITNTNDAPTISGTPSTEVTAGNAYSFRPTAGDVDGDNLVFSIVGRPTWANFDTATGSLSGTPNASHVGATGTITITVSDGTVTRSLPSFTITVNGAAPVIGSATLSWNSPVEREDGTPLAMNEISGYHIRYGNTSGNYTNTVDVTSAYTTDYTINNLAEGTWYFVVTAYDSEGRESVPSSEGSKTIQ